MDSAPFTTPPERAEMPEGWFDELPEEHRERILAQDAARLDSWDEAYRKQGRAWWTPCLQAAFLLAATASFVNGFDWGAFGAGFASGAIAGLLWHRFQADRLTSMLIAVGCFFTGLILTGHLSIFAIIWAPLPIGCVSALCGLRREELPGS